MHIFLTGKPQAGKTSIIKKYIARSGLSADGFVSYWETSGQSVQKLFLAPYGAGESGERYNLARRFGGDLIKVEHIEDIFNNEGTRILRESGKRDLIVMDELGVLESGATDFQEEVLRHISGNVPILGVIKPDETEFLNEIRSRSNVIIREVNIGNRNAILTQLLS